ncbi:hypothetical protein TH8_19755 [Thalassospira profundimaris]|nr:hypothetical protein TH8_19755 [Thalassospira profundimaris]
MAKIEISADMRQALIAAAQTNTIDGPRGRALAVIRICYDHNVKYVENRHVIVIHNTPVMVCQAVDIANELLCDRGLDAYRIDYPGAKFQSALVTGANDNHPLAAKFCDLRGGV